MTSITRHFLQLNFFYKNTVIRRPSAMTTIFRNSDITEMKSDVDSEDDSSSEAQSPVSQVTTMISTPKKTMIERTYVELNLEIDALDKPPVSPTVTPLLTPVMSPRRQWKRTRRSKSVIPIEEASEAVVNIIHRPHLTIAPPMTSAMSIPEPVTSDLAVVRHGDIEHKPKPKKVKKRAPPVHRGLSSYKLTIGDHTGKTFAAIKKNHKDYCSDVRNSSWAELSLLECEFKAYLEWTRVDMPDDTDLHELGNRTIQIDSDTMTWYRLSTDKRKRQDRCRIIRKADKSAEEIAFVNYHVGYE